MKKQLIGFILLFLICVLMPSGATAQLDWGWFISPGPWDEEDPQPPPPPEEEEEDQQPPENNPNGQSEQNGEGDSNNPPPPDPDPVVPESDNTPPPSGTSGGNGEGDSNNPNGQNEQNGEGDSNNPPPPDPDPVVPESDNTPPPSGTSGGRDSRDSNGGQNSDNPSVQQRSVGTFGGGHSENSNGRQQQQFAPEDVDRDGDVDSDDLLAVAMNFGKTPTGDLVRYDLNGDGDINSDDFLLVIQAMGGQSGTSGAPAASHTLSDTLAHIKGLNITNPALQQVVQLLEKQLAELNPKKTVLLANYPNPFNPETWIPYRLAKPADVTLTIYAANGQVVRSLALGHQPMGSYLDRARAAYWDGKNAFGEPVASGLYFYTLIADDFSATRKMLVAK